MRYEPALPLGLPLRLGGCAALEATLASRLPSTTSEIAPDNPSRFALELDKLDYSLAIAGDRWVSGDTSLSAGVPAGGTGRVSIPVTLTRFGRRIFVAFGNA